MTPSLRDTHDAVAKTIPVSRFISPADIADTGTGTPNAVNDNGHEFSTSLIERRRKRASRRRAH